MDLPKGLHKHGASYRMRIKTDDGWAWKNLGRDEHEAIETFHDLLGTSKSNLSAAIRRYKREILPKKAPKTQTGQTRQINLLDRVFGELPVAEITPKMAIDYLDKRGNVSGNREIALLRHILTKCVHWGMIPYNQLMRLQYRNPEKSRNRDVEPEEIRFVMRYANTRERRLIWLIYLTGLRREDALSLNRFNCKKDGIHLTEQKTGKKIRIEWTTSLEKLIEKLKPGFFAGISDSGIDSAWQRLRKKLKKDFNYELFQLKDLRAAHAGEVEDSGGDATRQLGHSSRALTQKHYLRKGRRVTPIR